MPVDQTKIWDSFNSHQYLYKLCMYHIPTNEHLQDAKNMTGYNVEHASQTSVETDKTGEKNINELYTYRYSIKLHYIYLLLIRYFTQTEDRTKQILQC